MIGSNIYLSFVRLFGPASVTPNFVHYWVVVVQFQNSGYEITRLCPFTISLLIYPSKDCSGTPLLPPPRFTRVPCQVQFACILSLSPYFLLSVRFCSVGRPPPAASGHPSSVGQKSTTLPLTADQCPAPGLLSGVPYELFPSPELCGW